MNDTPAILCASQTLAVSDSPDPSAPGAEGVFIQRFDWGHQINGVNAQGELELFVNGHASLTCLRRPKANYVQVRNFTDTNSIIFGFADGQAPYISTELGPTAATPATPHAAAIPALPGTDLRICPQGHLRLEPLQKLFIGKETIEQLVARLVRAELEKPRTNRHT